jgi:F0F1-type ATP synthase assembly protein I
MTGETGPRKPTGSKGADKVPSVSTYAGVGIQFAIAVVLFAFAGIWLDRKLGTSPLFVLLGVFVGAGAAFYSMYRKLMDAQERSERK